MKRGKIRVLIADDHTVVRQGLRGLLEREADIHIVGEASNGGDAVRKAQALRPDIVLMDISMPQLNGLEATRRIGKGGCGTQVVVLTMHNVEEHLHRLFAAGAKGYVLKDGGAVNVLAAIRAVHDGGIYIDPKASPKIIDSYVNRGARRAADETSPETLTPREREVVQLIAEGHTNRDIGRELQISVKTVETHRARIMEKLDIHNTADLVLYAVRHGMVIVV